MTVALHGAEGAPASWEERVRAELRPEFVGGVIVASAGGPALVGAACGVAECRRAVRAGGLCGAHHVRWRQVGRPPVEAWVLSAPARHKGVRPLRPCEVPGCRRGRHEAGLCQTHLLRWNRAGRPDLGVWTATGAGPPLRRLPPCPVAGCALEAEGRVGLCRSHHSRWLRHGRPPVAEFLVECETYGHDRFDLRGLPAIMRAEIAYGLQRRADEGRTQSRPDQLRRLLTRLPAGVGSLRERSEVEWLEVLGWQDRKSVARRFLTDTLEWLEDLAVGVGWDSEYGRDIWRLRRLGFPHRDAALRFDRIEPVWLRQLTKRWARWRLSVGIGPPTVSGDILAISLLAETFPQLRRGPHTLSRELLERHLAHLAIRYPHPKTRTAKISAVAGLLRTTRQHEWEPAIAATAHIYREDYPRLDEPAPRFITEAVMAQLESPANLDRWGDPQARVLAEILMGTGLRVGDACRLGIDCVVRDPQGAPYLRYRNHKMRRDALVPISDDLAAIIAARQDATSSRFPDAEHLVVRAKRNPTGRLHYSTDTFRKRLHAWLAACDVRDELGRPVRVTPHQWRHTYATRLINSEVPQEVVRRLLDHNSHHMTARYARLSQQTIRAEWEAARKVDIHGVDVDPPDGTLADAVWMKDNLARANMALPNGYCGLPLQQRCEYANACLTCPMFVTTAEFLPEHHRQLDATRALITQGEANGQARLVEMNRTVETNLLAIIATLGTAPGCNSCTHGGCGCGPTSGGEAADAS